MTDCDVEQAFRPPGGSVRIRHPWLLITIVLALAAPAWAEPRPLDAGWELRTDPAAQFEAAALPADGWRPVRVGVPWNAQSDDLRDYVGGAWYRVFRDYPTLARETRVPGRRLGGGRSTVVPVQRERPVRRGAAMVVRLGSNG